MRQRISLLLPYYFADSKYAFENDLINVYCIEGIIIILGQVNVFEQPEIEATSRILLVDDEIAVTDPLKKFLEENTDYSVFSTSNGQEAVAFLEENLVDLVITDVYHPGVNGLELTKFIKKNLNSDVIILTGNRETEYIDAISAGAGDIFYKPVLLKELLGSIRRVFLKRSEK
jgi:DNA-binding response OmpR family regulator